MLLLSRKIGESIIINGNITVNVIEIQGHRVKLGFEYPEGTSIYRKEVYLRIQAENERAMQTARQLNQAESWLAELAQLSDAAVPKVPAEDE